MMPGRSKLQDLLTNSASLTGPEREKAFEELVRLLMILVRARMDSRLRTHRESMDVCQSVARSFVEDWHSGKVSFENEAALAGYLQKVVRNKLTDLARHDTAARRGGGKADVPIDAEAGIGPDHVPSRTSTPSGFAMKRELEGMALAALTEEERRLVDMRRRGLDWEQIAEELGETSAALRKRWSRMQSRIMDGLEDPPSV